MCKPTNVKPQEQMDADRRKNDSKSSENGFPFDQWHSTPVKKHTDEACLARQTARSPPTTSDHITSLTLLQRSRTAGWEMEITTIKKQRMELQLLIAELKDRDQELNTMVAAHHKQLQAWEQDRQRVLTLEQKCTRLEDELQKRNEVIRAISKRLKVMEAREKDSQRELSKAKQQLQDLSHRQEHSSQQKHDLEERNQSLNSTIMTLSSQVGQLHVHEEELSSMLKLKDKDLMKATDHILALTSRLRETDTSLNKSQEHESKMLRETEEYKRRFREARHENVQLKDELQEKTFENNSQREELIRLKQENQLLRKELAIAGEGESWKDELLGLARSKQERTESELLCLRQVCEKQQNDLQLLKLNLDSTREALRQYEAHRSLGRNSNATGALENSDHQKTKIGESVNQQHQSRGTNTLPASLHLPMSHAIKNSLDSASAQSDTESLSTSTPTSGPSAVSQDIRTLSEQDLTCCEEEEHTESKTSPASKESSSVDLGSIVVHCCDCSNDATDNSSDLSDCEYDTEVDFVAVINCDVETESPVLLVDVSAKDLQCSSSGDVTCLYVDCPTPSPRSRRSPAPAEDAAFNTSDQQEEDTSSMNRLQRLLANSLEMVASLERSSGKSLSSTPSPTSQCNSVCSLRVHHNNSSNHNHSQSPQNSQGESQPIRVVDSPTQNSHQFSDKECDL